MDQLFYSHVRAFLLSHQVGEDPEKNLAKIKVIANSNPEGWDGKLPTRGIRPDATFWSVTESSRSQPVVPWWWYAREKEPVPEVVRDIYEGVAFDFVMVYQTNKAWIYVAVEPSAQTMKLLTRQDHVKAFLLMSLLNKTMPRAQREHGRVRLAGLMASKDIQKVFPFVAFKEDEPAYRSIPPGVPVLSRLVHPSSKTANWSIRLPGRKDIYGTFREIVPT